MLRPRVSTSAGQSVRLGVVGAVVVVVVVVVPFIFLACEAHAAKAAPELQERHLLGIVISNLR